MKQMKMHKGKKTIDRRKRYPPQVLILALCISLAQFFGLWFIHLAMTKGTDEIQWTPMLFQVDLNFCFSFLLISMAYRSFHLNRRVTATSETLEEEIREHKFKEASLQMSKDRAEAANIAKTAYLSNVSHEIRTPMNSIVGFSEILLEESLTEEQNDYVKTIYVNSKHLLELINNVLDLSKIESGKLEVLYDTFETKLFIERLDKIIRPTADAKGLDFKIVTDDSVSETIVSDEMHLRQCLINLLANAIKFTGSGSITLRLSSEASTVRFDVMDTGIGIPRDRLATVFEPFVQADQNTQYRYGGTGLGLAITKELVEMMGGTISVESVEGAGTTFTVELPCEAAAEATA